VGRAQALRVGVALRAYLISDGSRPGSWALARDLSEVFDTKLISPVFVSDRQVEDEGLIDARAFRAYHLRQPTLGEIGCALAHRQAQQHFVDSSLTTAAVFEDDARIGDTSILLSRTGIYEKLCSSEIPTLVNLNRDAIPTRLEQASSDNMNVSRALTPPYPATAYVLNRSAADAFISSQTPVRSQADWPRTQTAISYFVDRNSSVFEDRDITSSIDDQEIREQIPNHRKLRMWTGLWYWQFHKFFPSFHHYWNWHPRARILHHADAAVLKFGRSQVSKQERV